MSKKIGFPGVVAALVVMIVAAGCTVLSPYAALYGKWSQSNATFEFKTDDTWSFTITGSSTTVYSGTYTATSTEATLKGTKVTLNGTDVTSQYPGEASRYDGTVNWSVNGTTLTLSSGGSGSDWAKQ